MSSIDIRHPLIVCKASAGTGKTFTLAAYYIAMLFSGESYRNILAVTFTKAATTEMKERILTYLLGIADGGEQDFLRKVREYMLRDSEVSDQVLRSRAAANLHAILQDYDNFSVTTIDSFLQQLISGLAVAINRTADFAISLDVDQVIASAVDTMLTSELTDESKRTVFEYVEQCIGDSESWDIRKSLIRIATQLYKESVQVYSTRLSADVRLDLDAKRIADGQASAGAEVQKMRKGSLLNMYKYAAANGLYKTMPASKGNASEQLIKNYVAKFYPEWGKIVSVSCDQNWKVETNSLGKPIYRHCGTQILCEDQGYKVIHGISIHQDYSGGKYGNSVPRNDKWFSMVDLVK